MSRRCWDCNQKCCDFSIGNIRRSTTWLDLLHNLISYLLMVSAAFCNSVAPYRLVQKCILDITDMYNISVNGRGEGKGPHKYILHIFRKIFYRGSLKRRIDLLFVFYCIYSASSLVLHYFKPCALS
jgi:hypothetical protein